mgnify:FL=1|jgi:hypothetical protein
MKTNEYPAHVLEIPKMATSMYAETISEKTIFLDPTKYKFNEETKSPTRRKNIMEWRIWKRIWNTIK